MQNLTLGQLISYANHLVTTKKVTAKELMELPIYLSDDDELNGVHTCFGISLIEDDEESEMIREMINDNYANIPLDKNKKAILL